MLSFIEAAILSLFNRSSIYCTVCTRPDSHACFFLFFLLFIVRCLFFRVFFVPLPYNTTSYVFPSRTVFFYLVTTSCWIFDISYDVRIQSINSYTGGVWQYLKKSYSFLFVVFFVLMPSLELCRCPSDLFLTSRPRTGLATTHCILLGLVEV